MSDTENDAANRANAAAASLLSVAIDWLRRNIGLMVLFVMLMFVVTQLKTLLGISTLEVPLVS